jgi:hypothetical protein
MRLFRRVGTFSGASGRARDCGPTGGDCAGHESTLPVPAIRRQDFHRKDVDNRADVLTVTGYAKQHACGVQSFSPGKNCVITEMPDSPGVCWKTNYGEYRCSFVNVGVGYHPDSPPPTAY